jgi:hypothetical protein
MTMLKFGKTGESARHSIIYFAFGGAPFAGVESTVCSQG